jgi:hypothetical protein
MNKKNWVAFMPVQRAGAEVADLVQEDRRSAGPTDEHERPRAPRVQGDQQPTETAIAMNAVGPTRGRLEIGIVAPPAITSLRNLV